jgi:L-malate glycosyltransferase
MQPYKPTILILNPSGNITGPLVSSHAFAHALCGEVTMLLVSPSNPRYAHADYPAFHAIETIPLVNLSRRIKDIICYVPSLLVGGWKLHRIAKRTHAHAIIINDIYCLHGLIVRALGFRGRIITIIHAHPKHLLGRMSGFFLWQARRSSHQLVTVSESVKKGTVNAKDIVVIPNIFLPSTVSPSPSDQPRLPHIVCVGNIIQGKGQEVVLRAFLQIAGQFPDAHLHFYGHDMGLEKNKAYLQSLKDTAHQSSVASQIHFHGFTHNVAEVLHSARMAVNASVSESFSMTVLEAQGYGVPVIATRCGGPEEIILDGTTGFLVPIGDDEAIAAKICILLEDAALAARMGEAAQAHVKQCYSAAAITPLWHKILAI